MSLLNPYLNFPGNTEEAFNFYKTVFGGEFVMLTRMKESPGGDELPADIADKIMHISLPIGNGNILMGTDAIEKRGHKITTGTNFHLVLSTDTKEETEKIFNSLAEGGKITTPLETMFWGAYFGMLTDKFDIQWMISYEEKK